MASDRQMQALIVMVSLVTSPEGKSHYLWEEPLGRCITPPLDFDFLLAP